MTTHTTDHPRRDLRMSLHIDDLAYELRILRLNRETDAHLGERVVAELTAQIKTLREKQRPIRQFVNEQRALTGNALIEDPVSDDEMAALNDRHKWSA